MYFRLQRKFSVVKNADGILADNLIRVVIFVFPQFGLPKKIVLDAGTNFISLKFKQFCRQMNIQQAVTSSYYHHSNGQVEVCMKFMKHTIKY